MYSSQNLIWKSIQISKTVINISTGENYKIKVNINCSTSNIVYQLQCKHFATDYIGKTILELLSVCKLSTTEQQSYSSTRFILKLWLTRNENQIKSTIRNIRKTMLPGISWAPTVNKRNTWAELSRKLVYRLLKAYSSLVTQKTIDIIVFAKT